MGLEAERNKIPLYLSVCEGADIFGVCGLEEGNPHNSVSYGWVKQDIQIIRIMGIKGVTLTFVKTQKPVSCGRNVLFCIKKLREVISIFFGVIILRILSRII